MKKTSLSNILFVISSILAFILFWGFPDLDITVLGIGRHRNFLFHSAIVPALMAILVLSKKETPLSFIKNGFILGSSLSIGFHLLIDIFQPKSVDFIIVSTLIKGTLIDDRIWLGMNSLIGFLIGKRANDYRIENIKDIRRKSKID